MNEKTSILSVHSCAIWLPAVEKTNLKIKKKKKIRIRIYEFGKRCPSLQNLQFGKVLLQALRGWFSCCCCDYHWYCYIVIAWQYVRLDRNLKKSISKNSFKIDPLVATQWCTLWRLVIFAQLLRKPFQSQTGFLSSNFYMSFKKVLS